MFKPAKETRARDQPSGCKHKRCSPIFGVLIEWVSSFNSDRVLKVTG